MENVIRFLIYGFLIYILFSLYCFYVYIHPAKFKSEFIPKDLGLEYEDIIFQTEDWIKLAGWFIPQKNSQKAIIVCHGYPADKGNVLGTAKFLSGHYNLLLFDFRGLGKSEGRFSTGGWKERQDFFAAVRFLKERGFSDIGALGFSMGAAVILMANSPDIKAIVSDSSYASLDSVLKLIFRDFGFLRPALVGMMKLWSGLFLKMKVNAVSPLKSISQIKVPVFLIHSELDSQIPLEHAQLLYQANPQNHLWIVPGLDHGEGFALRQEEYQEKVLRFFEDNLK